MQLLLPKLAKAEAATTAATVATVAVANCTTKWKCKWRRDW